MARPRGLAATIFATWLGLVALQALASKSAPGRIQSLAADVSGFVERALDPTVPAIPDRRTTTTTPRG